MDMFIWNDDLRADYHQMSDRPERCGECGATHPRHSLLWVNDRYGIPYLLVCLECEDSVRERAESFVHDPMFAGERLDEDY